MTDVDKRRYVLCRYSCIFAVLWIQIHWIWIRIQDFGPIWIWIQGYTINFGRKNLYKKILEKKIPLKTVFFYNYKNKMSPKETFIQLSLWIVNLHFYLHFILYLNVWIVDPYPYSEYGSGSRKLLNTDPKRAGSTTIGRKKRWREGGVVRYIHMLTCITAPLIVFLVFFDKNNLLLWF